MPGVYPFPEMDDVVYGYLKQVYDETDGPVSAVGVTYAMNRDLPSSPVSQRDVMRALDSLADKRLVHRSRHGFAPFGASTALGRQLVMEEVRPFTREYGETPEAHEDKTWDFRTALEKPRAGGKWGLGATGHLIPSDVRWRGLTQDF